MSRLDVNAMAAQVVSLIKSALTPVQAQVATLDAQLADLSRRAQDDSLATELGNLRERVAIVETKATPELPPPVDLEPVLARIAALEAPPPSESVASEDLAASLTGLLTKELEALGGTLARPLIQKRVVRDANGKIERVVEEPAA